MQFNIERRMRNIGVKKCDIKLFPVLAMLAILFG